MILWIFIPIIAIQAADDFDDFFTFSDDPHPTDVLIDQLAHTIQLAHGLSTQLENKVIESGDDKGIETLAIDLNDKTGELSSVMTQPMIIAMKEAAKILRSSRTCQDLVNLGITQSGRYEIDPDGPENEEPIEVYCDFNANTTEIVHDKANQSLVIPEVGQEFNFEVNFDYQVPMGQVQALIELSEACEQSIRFDCFLTPLMSFGNDSKGSWKDRNGTARTFFHGNLEQDQPHQCQCGLDQTCVVPKLPCNCDAKLPDWQVDEGVITDKDLLPMTGFAYGPIKYDLEQAKVSIGSLKCSGRLHEQNIGPNLGRILADDKYINPDQVKSYIIFGYGDYGGSTFDSARLSCLRKGGKLAEPMNSRENQQIFSKLGDGKRHYWIGLTDVNNEGQ